MRLTPTKRVVLYALVTWLGGFGCVAGCLAQTSAAPLHAEHEQVSEPSPECGDGCCESGSTHDGGESAPAGAADCCVYSAMPPATLAKKAADAPPVALAQMLAKPAPALSLPLVAAPVAAAFDSGGLYLQIRILRI